MIKPEEIAFRLIVLRNEGKVPRAMISFLSNMHYYWLSKWTKKCFWDYGVSMRTGWLTESGKEEFKKHESNNND